jgi:hypothetical protein
VIPVASAFGARHVAFAAGVIFLGSMVAPLALGSLRRLGSVPVAAEVPMQASVAAI